MIKAMYAAQVCAVQPGEWAVRVVPCQVRVYCQGCLLSPILFVILEDFVLQALEQATFCHFRARYTTKPQTSNTRLHFADDIVFAAHCQENIQQ